MKCSLPSQDNVWEQFSKETGGQYFSGGIRNGYWAGESGVLCQHNGATIQFDTYQEVLSASLPKYTRVQARYSSPEPIDFSIRSSCLVDQLLSQLPGYSIKTKYKDFNSSFICKASNELHFKEIMESSLIKHLISQPSELLLKSKTKHGWGIFSTPLPAGEAELYLRVPGIEKDMKRLNLYHQIITELLDRIAVVSLRHAAAP